MIVKPALATQGFKEALCTVEETVSLGKRDCKCDGFSNDDPYCEPRHWLETALNIYNLGAV